MIKKISFLLVITVLAAHASLAEDKELPVPALVERYVETLEMVKPALLNVYELVNTHDIWSMKDDPNYALRPSDIPSLSDRLEHFNEILTAAAVEMEPFLKSADDSIQTAAARIKQNYETLARENEKSISELGAFSANPAASAEDLKNIQYEVENRISSFNSSLYHASEWVAEAVWKAYPSGDLSRIYPESERADILTRLEILADGKSPVMYEGVHFQNALWPLHEALNTHL